MLALLALLGSFPALPALPGAVSAPCPRSLLSLLVAQLQGLVSLWCHLAFPRSRAVPALADSITSCPGLACHAPSAVRARGKTSGNGKNKNELATNLKRRVCVQSPGDGVALSPGLSPCVPPGGRGHDITRARCHWLPGR